jgi:hypothetical protein
VRAAKQATEVDALNQRYDSARKTAEACGCTGVAEAFEEAVKRSKAVVARALGEVERLAASDCECFSTYYKQVEAELRLPDDSRWGPMRQIAEEALFPEYKREIRFASLTLDDQGLPSYGNCFIVLRTSMIAHRSSVYDGNNVLLMAQRDLRFSEQLNLPPGYRATWEDRARLSLAKLGARLEPRMTPEQFPALLQHPGKSTADDDLVEVHIYGPITIRAVEKVILTKQDQGRAARTKRRIWAQKLDKDYGVKLEGT